MLKSKPLCGIIPPLVTPLKDNETLDVESLEKLIEHLIAGGVHGLFILGTTGEEQSLSYGVRQQMIRESARINNGRLPLLVCVTDTSMVESIRLAGVAADCGADEAGTFVNKILVNKIDKEKIGRKFLTQPKYTQIGIATAIKNSENYIIVILAENEARMRSNIPLPDCDLTELKQAFDFFDIYKRGEIYPKIVLENLIDLGYHKTNPQLCEIIEGFLINGDDDIIDFPIFANHIVNEISDKRTNEGLRIIFELFVDDKEEDTISIGNMKKIVTELGDEDALSKINQVINFKNGINAKLNYDQFYHYMKKTYANDEIAAKVQQIQRMLGKSPTKILETIIETNESSLSERGSRDNK